MGHLTPLGIIMFVTRIAMVLSYLFLTPIADALGSARFYALASIISCFLNLIILINMYVYGIVLFLLLPMLAVYAAFYALVPLTMDAMIPSIFSEKILMVDSIIRASKYASLTLPMLWAVVFDMLGALNSLMILGSAFLAILVSTLVFLALKHDTLANPHVEDLSFYKYLSLRSVGEGFKIILRESWMLKLILYLSLNIVASTAVFIYIVAIADIVIGPQAYAYSIPLIMLGMAATAGATISPKFIRKISVVLIIVVSIIAYFLLMLILAIGIINRDPLTTLLTLACYGFFSGVSDVAITYLYQLLISEHIRARIFGLRSIIVTAVSAVSSYISSLLSDGLGLGLSLIVLSMIHPLSATLLLRDRANIFARVGYK
ncbi:MAG: hypothetical protein QXQ57_04540 [Sulfolobales archaeon]